MRLWGANFVTLCISLAPTRLRDGLQYATPAHTQTNLRSELSRLFTVSGESKKSPVCQIALIKCSKEFSYLYKNTDDGDVMFETKIFVIFHTFYQRSGIKVVMTAERNFIIYRLMHLLCKISRTSS